MTAPIIAVWNAHSGTAKQSAAVLESLQSRSDVVVYPATHRGDLLRQVERAIQAEPERLWVAGGDGTVNAAVDRLMHAEKRPPLGIIPIGTANDFVRTLALPPDPAEALGMLDTAAVHAIDVVSMDDTNEARFFLNMATAGNSDRVIEQVTEEEKYRWGPLSYLWGALQVAQDLTEYTVRLEADQDTLSGFSLWSLLLANGRWSGGGLPVAPRANPSDGKIDLIVVRTGTLPNLIEVGARLWFNQVLESDLVEHHQVRRVSIQSDPPLRFTADGDLVEWVPIRFECVSSAVEMFVGPEFSADPVP